MASRAAAFHDESEGTSLIAEFESSLCQNMGRSFVFWYHDVDGWKPIDDSDDHGDPQIDTSIFENAQKAGGEPVIVDQRDGQPWLVVPVPGSRDRDLLAAAPVSTDDPDLLLRLAQLSVRDLAHRETLERLSDENSAFAQQVTSDFEELTFLRQIAEYIEISTGSQDFLQLTERVLPLLLPTVKAECVAFVEDRSRNQCLDVPKTGRILLHGDKTRCADEVWRHLVERYHHDAIDRPVVKNCTVANPTICDYPEVAAFVLVQVAKEDRNYGWLVSVNRAPGHGYEVQGFHGLTSDLEYGTAEATLLITAASVLATQARNIELFREKEQLLTNVVRALVSAVEAKDNYTCGHSERVAAFGQRLAERLGLDQQECDRVYLAGLLHDVGKIGVSDATLRKPSSLTDEELEEIRRHPDSGWAILHELQQLAHILPGVLYHHERYDGGGYPDGLAGEEIPVDGRILAVADAYDAMTSNRPYRSSMSQEKALSILREGAGRHWDPKLVEAFIEVMPEIIELRDNYTQRCQAKRRRRTLHVDSGRET